MLKGTAMTAADGFAGPDRTRLLHRLKRIAGQVAGIQRMVEEGRYCADILTQIAALRSALDAVGVEVLTDHMAHCVSGHAGAKPHPEAAGKTVEELQEEVRVLLGRFLR
jgi:DNA-binding FrmR family transcriptional regulator